MKKFLSLMLALLMLCTAVPTSVFALNNYVVFDGIDGCRLTALSILDADNPWLLYDIPMTVSNNGRVYTTSKDHPNLISTTAKLHVEYEGAKVTFNGTDITDGAAVKLEAQNELVVYDNDKNYAEYVVIITEVTNGLPVVLVDTVNYSSTDPSSPLYNEKNPYNPENPINTKLEYCNSHLSLLGGDIYDAGDIYDLYCGIKLRGNSTMSYAKKPYRLKFNEKPDVLGMGKAKSWVLLADYLDPTGLRNGVAYKLADRVYTHSEETTGHYKVFSPRMKYVELYIDGDFKGLYEMGDHMQANKYRVNINELGDEDNASDFDGSEIGYFIEFEVMSRVLDEGEDDFGDWSAFSYIVDVDGTQDIEQKHIDRYSGSKKNKLNAADLGKEALFFQYKLPEEPTEAHREYITDYMQTINDLTLDEDASNDAQIWEMLDMDSVVNWYLINELFKNADSQMQSSVYFYKDGTLDGDGEVKENPDTKLHMAPVWDFDLGAGGVSYGAMNDPTEWRTRNDEYCGWFREFFEMPEFNAAVEARWAELHEEGILDAITTDIDAFKDLVGEAALENFEMWHDTYLDEIDGSWMTVPEVSKLGDWDASTEYLRSWLTERIKWMDGGFGYNGATNSTVSSTTVKKTSKLFENEVVNGSAGATVTLNIDRDIPVDELAMELDITSTCRFDLGFDMDVTMVDGNTYSHTANLCGDWSNNSVIKDKISNKKVVAGTYNDMICTLNGCISWNFYQSNAPSDFNTNPAAYIKTVHLNSVKITFASDATTSDKVTFSTTMFNQAVDAVSKVTATKSVKTISGKPIIAGVPAVGNTLTALNTQIKPSAQSDNALWLKNVWYVNGTQVAVGPTYTVKSSDLGKEITVKSTGIFKLTGTSSTSDAVTVTLSTQNAAAAPAAPVSTGATRTSITLTNVAGQEYSINGKDWFSTTASTYKFTDLTAGQCYQIVTRVKATSTTPAGEISDPLVIITSANAQDYQRGDVDADGTLKTADAVLSLMHALDFIELKRDEIVNAADFNADGAVTTSDARYILRAIVGLD
ncbi:MAG: CotH kinase family protein [Clostridia bacterium]|nr:CotH kinase family protein [Clostridia bacterium]